MANGLNTKVKPAAIKILLGGIVLLILVNLLARFGVIDFTAFQSNIITLIGAFFLLTEVAFFQMLGKAGRGKTNVISLLIGIIAILAIIGVLLGFGGIEVAALSSIQGIVDIGLLIAVVMEIFR